MSKSKSNITGVFHKNFKNGWTHTEIRNRGYLMSKYRYPIIERRFNSKLVNYDNLHLCGGWYLDGVDYKNQCILRVLKDVKPFGEETYTTSEEVDKIEETINKHSNKNNFKYVVTKRPKKDPWYADVIIASIKTFSDIFDINNLMEDYGNFLYKKVPIRLYDGVLFNLEELKQYNVSGFLDNGYEYWNPEDAIDYATTGLMLGYPIETTVSLIIRNFGI